MAEKKNEMNNIARSILILFIFLNGSCDNKNNMLPLNVIPVANTVGNDIILNLSDYVTEIKYLPLETNDTVLVGANFRICYENGHILVSEPLNNCNLFDDTGKFYRKIGQRGQGPYDYFMLVQAFLYEDQILLNDNQKILTYDKNGYMIEKINLWSNDIQGKYREGDVHLFPLKKDTFVMNVIALDGDYPKAILFEMHQSGAKKIKEYPNFITLDKVRRQILGGERGNIYLFENDVRTYKPINDTIFTIRQNTEMQAAFIFDFGNYGRPIALFEGKMEGDIRTLLDNYIFPYAIYESINYLFIEFDFGNRAPESFTQNTSRGTQVTNSYVYGVFDKRTGELTFMRQPIKEKLGFKNDIDNGPVIWPKYISSNDELVSTIQPEEFMEYYNKIQNPSAALKEIADRLEIDDNPIVIVAKLK